ncbi:amino acid aminotransferase [Marinomonas epiphytica]
MFESLKPAAKDPILSQSLACLQDPRTNKLDLGIGVYRNEFGQTPVLDAVRRAEQVVYNEQTSKAYVGLAGCEIFNQRVMDLIIGEDNASRSRAVGVQTPGASGALRLLADVIALSTPNAKVWLSDLSYANHAPIMRAAGLEVAYYPYFDKQTKGVNENVMLEALKSLGTQDIVLLHACCHNPTGADLSFAGWQELTQMALRQGFLPFIDIAYQGFGDGMDEDVAGFRYLANKVPQYLLAGSCSKNFGLYRERTGIAAVVMASKEQGECVKSRLLELARSTYTMPPDHGAAIVRTILSDEVLKASWLDEVGIMRARVQGVRRELVAQLRVETQTNDFDFIAQHKGMFSVLGVSDEQVTALREEYAMYLVAGGRMNVAGVLEKDVPLLASALAQVSR